MIAAARDLWLLALFVGLPVIALIAAIRLRHDDEEERERRHG